jgi:hypothetical protein
MTREIAKQTGVAGKRWALVMGSGSRLVAATKEHHASVCYVKIETV